MQILKLIAIVLFMMGTGLLIWTISPEGRVERIFIIDPEFSLFSKKMECEEIQNLFRAKYNVNYPRSIHYGEYGVIQVDFINDKIDKNKITEENEYVTCGIALEVWIDGGDVVVEPGNRIIKANLNGPSQFIKFEIFPTNDQVVKGKLWINAVFPGDGGSVLERIPIFVIPYVIQVHSHFGLHVTSMRFLSSFLIILSLALVNFQNKNDRTCQ